MARRTRKSGEDYIDEMMDLFDSTTFCCCPECGNDCTIDKLSRGKGIDLKSIDFTCAKCGHFTANHNLLNGEWKLKGSGLLYLPCTDGNDLTLYQRFDESAYPTRADALEAKYEIMEGLLNPLLDLHIFSLFEKIDKDILDCSTELSEMGVAKYKGVQARFLISRNSVGTDPIEPFKGELLRKIESLVEETDFEGMIEALLALFSYECSGLESGIERSAWEDLLVEKCLRESEGLGDSDKVLLYLRACIALNPLEATTKTHELAIMAIRLILENPANESADDMLTEAYSYTDPDQNSLELECEIFEHFRGRSDEYPEPYYSALFEICMVADKGSEMMSRALSELDKLIEDPQDILDFDPAILMRAYFVRYHILGNPSDLKKAFDIAADSDELVGEPMAITVITEYLLSVRNDRSKCNRALKKLDMQGMDVDEVISLLDRYHDGLLSDL